MARLPQPTICESLRVNTGTDHLAYFQSASMAWSADGVFAELRVIGRVSTDRNELLKASVQVGVNPHVPTVLVRTDELLIAKRILGPLSIAQSMKLLAEAENGRVSIEGVEFSLPEGSLSYYAKVPSDDEWNYTLNLTCRSDQCVPYDSLVWSAINAQLRCAETPFDGISDVSLFLGLPNPSTSTEPQINIYVHAPAELDASDSTFVDDELNLKFKAIPGLNLQKVSVGLRWAKVAFERRQVAELISWSAPAGMLREGRLTQRQANADGALVMLSVGGHPVRRHWVVGSHRATTIRTATLQAFDPGWERLRDSLLTNTKDSKGFEKAVATLAFLLGFQVVPYTDSDAPDLALFTGAGRVVLVECTLRTSDVHSKLGKLVNRRGAVANNLSRLGTQGSVFCLLVCQSTREQILIEDSELRKSSVLLIAREQLDDLLLRIRFDPNADAILDESLKGGSVVN